MNFQTKKKAFLLFVVVIFFLYRNENIHFIAKNTRHIFDENDSLSSINKELFLHFISLNFQNYNQKKDMFLLVPNKYKRSYIDYSILNITNYTESNCVLFPFLKKVNAVLLDIELLKNINFFKSENNLRKRVENFKSWNNPSQIKLVTFGIHPDSFHQLNEVT